MATVETVEALPTAVFSLAEQEKILADATIDTLPFLVEKLLDYNQRGVFNRIFKIKVEPIAPLSFHPGTAEFVSWRFKSKPQELQNQTIVTIKNKVLDEASLFNKLRASRPIQSNNDGSKIKEELTPSATCDFCHPFTNTPIDLLGGRFLGKYSVTVADGAPFYPVSCQVLASAEFHNPMNLDEAVFEDMVMLANQWVNKVGQENSQIGYPIINWNHGRKAGQSVFPHPHLRVGFSDPNFEPDVEKLWRGLAKNRWEFKYPLFNDMAYALTPLGLVFPQEVAENPAKDPKIIFDLTPRKEKGVWVVASSLDNKFTKAIFSLISWYRQTGVTNFNMSIYLRPEGIFGSDPEGFPNIARLVERGSDSAKNSDIGAMEAIIGTPVISADPLVISKDFRQYLENQI